MLGFGDVILPGLLVSFMRRVDLDQGTKSWAKVGCVLVYLHGLRQRAGFAASWLC